MADAVVGTVVLIAVSEMMIKQLQRRPTFQARRFIGALGPFADYFPKRIQPGRLLLALIRLTHPLDPMTYGAFTQAHQSGNLAVVFYLFAHECDKLIDNKSFWEHLPTFCRKKNEDAPLVPQIQDRVRNLSQTRKDTCRMPRKISCRSTVRVDLREFAESIGFEPILSEFDSFPVNPNQNTLGNCLDAVKNRTDIFVLVVGGRYGSITDTGRSITNLEYFEAKAKGIPKYVFIKDNVLSLLQTWKDNPDSDYSSAVDNPALFKFIEDLRDSGDVWVFPFSNAQSIIGTLKKQLSYLFADCLDLRAKGQEKDLLISSLGPKAFRLAVEKSAGWEWLLFAQVLSDKIGSHNNKRIDVELGISFGEPIVLDKLHDVTTWISSRFEWISTTIEQLSKALKDGFIKAVGEPGVPGDIKRIVHLATRVGDGYEQLLDYNLKFLRASCDEDFKTILKLASEFSSNAIREIEEFSKNLYTKIEGYVNKIDSYKERTVIEIPLFLTVPNPEPFYRELARLKASLRL